MGSSSTFGPGRTVMVSAPAKINLFLHIVGRRRDDMHELQSLFAFARYGDELYLDAASELTLEISGPFAEALGKACPRLDSNIIVQAAHLYAQRVGQSDIAVRIRLKKSLPVEAGIGGGSADAAATLRGLRKVWALPTSDAELEEIAADLGADVPACVNTQPKLVEGIGERIWGLSHFAGVPILLANPRENLSTAAVFAHYARSNKGFSPKIDLSLYQNLDQPNLLEIIRETQNDLEATAAELCPDIGVMIDELARLPGALSARMSGSGATCFAIFEQMDEAKTAANLLRTRHPGWWVEVSELIGFNGHHMDGLG